MSTFIIFILSFLSCGGGPGSLVLLRPAAAVSVLVSSHAAEEENSEEEDPGGKNRRRNERRRWKSSAARTLGRGGFDESSAFFSLAGGENVAGRGENGGDDVKNRRRNERRRWKSSAFADGSALLEERVSSRTQKRARRTTEEEFQASKENLSARESEAENLLDKELEQFRFETAAASHEKAQERAREREHAKERERERAKEREHEVLRQEEWARETEAVREREHMVAAFKRKAASRNKQTLAAAARLAKLRTGVFKSRRRTRETIFVFNNV